MNDRHEWDSYSHQRLYDRIHGNGGFFTPDGAGVSGAAGAQEGWAELTDLMASARERTEAALAKAGAVWEGGAADAMRSGVTPLAQWAEDAQIASIASQASTDIHVSAYSSAKNSMPEPIPVNSTANSDFVGIPAGFTHLFGGQTDQDRQEAAAQEAKAEAVRIMTGYEDHSGAARSSVGQFVPPPSVTVEVAQAQPKSTDVIPVGGGEPPRSGQQSIDDSTRSAGDTRGPGAAPPPASTPLPPGNPTPPPGSTPTPPGTTTPSDVTTRPAALPPTVSPVGTGVVPDQQRPVTSLSVPPGPVGLPGERGVSGGRGPVGGGGPGGGGPAGRGPVGGMPGGGGPGSGGGIRGAMPGGAVGEPVPGRAGAVGGTGARGAGGMGGLGPMGGRGEGDEDKEHTSAEYLRDFHDSFWDDTPPVAPPVIGDEDDD